ncbi:MAG: cytochrome c peroxidase [Glaciecola sp.]|jgi:cytochrome c peroxidase
MQGFLKKNCSFGVYGPVHWKNKRPCQFEKKKEMGFSGENGQPSFDSLLSKLESIDHYEWFFNLACATTEITEQRIQFAIADFVRSIQSFDSRFDIGMQMVDSAHFPFPNYTTTENLGENIFTGYENSGTCNA